MKIQKDMKFNNNHQKNKVKFPMKLGFPQNPKVHQNPTIIPRKRPYLQKEGPNQTKEYPSLQKRKKYLKGN
jgi:hypothetical protein